MVVSDHDMQVHLREKVKKSPSLFSICKAVLAFAGFIRVPRVRTGHPVRTLTAPRAEKAVV